MTNFIHDNLILVFFALALMAVVLLLKFLKRPELGLYLTFFATGILIAPKLPILREKFTGVEILMTLTWTALLLRSVSSPRSAKLTKSQSNSLILGAVFIGWIVLSFAINNATHPITVTENFGSLIETFNFIYGYLMFITVVFMARDWSRWKSCLNSWLWGAVVVSAFGLWALSGHGPSWTYDSFTHRVCSTLRTENQVPSFLLPIFVVLVFMIAQRGRRPRDKWALTVLLAGVSLTAIASGSRTSLLMLAFSGIGIVYITLRESRYRAFNKERLIRISFFAIFTFIAYVLFALAGYKGDYALGHTPAWKRPVLMLYEWTQGSSNLDDNRTEQLKVVSENISDNLVMGTGPKNYGYYGVEEIHNTYAGILFQTGVPGLIFFLFWILTVLQTGLKAGKRIPDPHQRLIILCMVAGMVLLLLYSLTMFGLRQRNIWLLAGLLVASDSFVPRRRSPILGPLGSRMEDPTTNLGLDSSMPKGLSSLGSGGKP